MANTVPALSVRKSVVVNTAQARAFEVFTRGFDSWWPKGHHIGKAEMLAAIIEPRTGGRWYEKGVDGSECDWGTVIAYESPSRVVLSWHLNGRWEYDADPARASEVEVRFIAESPTRTRVELEHRGLDKPAFAEELRGGIDSPQGWSGLLAMFAAKAQTA
ncbi:MAG: SRPBCC family protein [Vicinamibacterales bacterium]